MPASPATGLIDRRGFVTWVTALGLWSCARLPPRLAAAPSTLPTVDRAYLDQSPWPVLAAVLAHLLPSGVNTPGADDFHALDYLHNSLSNTTDIGDWDRVLAGSKQLQQLATAQHGQVFEQLDSARREVVLRALEASAGGQQWLAMLMVYLLEALLADPLYGGNSDASGWQWLAHQPGFPRPPTGHAWYRMQARLGQRQQKAVG